jgi:hypothetical protein
MAKRVQSTSPRASGERVSTILTVAMAIDEIDEWLVGGSYAMIRGV